MEWSGVEEERRGGGAEEGGSACLHYVWSFSFHFTIRRRRVPPPPEIDGKNKRTIHTLDE